MIRSRRGRRYIQVGAEPLDWFRIAQRHIEGQRRYRIDHDRALHRLEQAGAVITTSEAAVFEWVGGAGSPKFKEISRLVQERMKYL